MSDSEDEHVYANTNANARPELTLKVRHVGGETREAELLQLLVVEEEEERGEREDRGEREERIVDIYATADDLLQPAGSGTRQDGVSPRSAAPRQDAVSPRSAAPQQDAVSPRSAAPRQDAVSPRSAAPQQDAVSPRSAAPQQGGVSPRSAAPRQDGVSPRSAAPQQQQHGGGGSGEPKNNGSRAAAVCLGLMCLLLSAGIIGLVVHNNYLVKHVDQLELQARVTRQNLTEQKAGFDELHTRYTNVTQDNAKLQTSLNELHTRYTNMTEERDDLKRRHCELLGWQKSVHGCYYISSERKTWNESRQYCRDHQSDLVVIHSKGKQDFVKGLNTRVWLGLTDTETEGTFMWVDGTTLTKPTFWSKGEPNNKGQDGAKEEDCVEFVNESPTSKEWNDRSCTNYNQWICETRPQRPKT